LPKPVITIGKAPSISLLSLVGGEGRIRTYGRVSRHGLKESGRPKETARIKPLSHLSVGID
jgi:hypothetical protein